MCLKQVRRQKYLAAFGTIEKIVEGCSGPSFFDGCDSV